MKVVVTGGCGFIGSNFIRHILRNREHVRVINLDKLTYAGNLANLIDVARDYAPDRYRFVKGDISDWDTVRGIFSQGDIDWVVNFAAESHVDRSIEGPEEFLHTNILGTFRLLEAARQFWSAPSSDVTEKRFLHISTDEVYGSLGPGGYFTETTPYDPSSPYSASKAASDHLVNAYHRTYSLPTLITNSSNNYGPFQFPEKLIPLIVINAIKGNSLPVYGDGKNVRDWLHVGDHCSALLAVLETGVPGEKYNIGANCERRNIDIVTAICDYLDTRLGLLEGKPRRELIQFVTDRLGHDRRYAIDATKVHRDLHWEPTVSFEQGIIDTIEWYLDHMDWVSDIESGRYREYQSEG
ncbi:MAG: dTDP-glucose 4,6-dehydratase [Deltaproteobacteria bacterium]|nr:dTDP-glucose 4,6-dehydratase [Deltaproteobacteria bacterium]MBW2077022.1 dTDP-glucose 4,6-dehydratase [Deltaproteobacteria bacterium]MBW2312378.1 dTDP-glucose 4,6-dehydratase [Deltaproteobacteria bacterium]RLB28040.1 MAG: dTDP-glucose 4,6-dehydratase [Deltaproteobacteria bacterium]